MFPVLSVSFWKSVSQELQEVQDYLWYLGFLIETIL